MTTLSTQSWIDNIPTGESRDVWQDRISSIPEENGFYQRLGAEHSALYVKRGQTLIVSFESLVDVYRSGEHRLPWGLGVDHPSDWSVLGVMAHASTWFRDEDVFDFFDKLRDDGFFDQFDQMIFCGFEMGAYAACVFSSAAPGSTVISISPQATLARDLTPWETRFRSTWRRDFTSRYGYGPEMVKDSDQVYLFYDPLTALDAMHAVLFQGDNVTKLKCRFMGGGIQDYWTALEVHDQIIERCIDQNLSEAAFYHIMRKRHQSSRYQKAVLNRLIELEKHELVVAYCTAVLTRRRAPAFRQEKTNSLEILEREE